MSCFLPCANFVGIPANANIGGDDHPIRFARERSHPYGVFLIRLKALFKMGNFMFRLNGGAHCSRQLRGKIVVEEKIHAANCRSNSTASLTAF